MICTEYIIFPYINQVSGVEQSRKVFHKHIKSYLYVEIYAFNCVSFEKLCAVILFRFQWQTDTVFPFDFLEHGFNSISPWRRRRTKIHNKVNKKRKVLLR